MTYPELTWSERSQRSLIQVAAFEKGQQAASALREALALVDLTVPSLCGDMPVNGHGFVHLGGCRAELALRIAEVITAGARTLQDQHR